MNTPINPAPGQQIQPSLSERLRTSSALVPTLVVLVVAVAGLAAALAFNRGADDGIPVESVASAVSAPAPAKSQAAVRAPVANSLVAQGPVERAVQAPVERVAPRPVARPPVVARSVCTTCGVVESVTPITRAGQVEGIANSGIGVGAIGGAVIGGLLGNQVGGGSGRTAATVLGAAGGGYAGNAIEKNMKKVTVYQMRVRMQDGSYRTIEKSNAIEAGTSVIVEGDTIRVGSTNS